MSARRRKKSSSGFWGHFTFILLIASISFFLGANRDQVRDILRNQMPRAKSTVLESTPKMKSFAGGPAEAVRNFTAKTLSSAKGIFTSDPQIDSRDGDIAFRSSNRPAERPVISGETYAPVPNDAREGEQITVASFNVRLLSDSGRTDEDLRYIAAVLKDYDIIALQEARDRKVLVRLTRILSAMGYPFKFEASPLLGDNAKELYAFFYRTDRITMTRPGRLYPDRRNDFDLEPFYASFRAGNFQFTLLTVHVPTGDSANEKRPEIQQLTRVYNYVQREEPGNKKIILLGSFNFPPDDHGWHELKQFASMTHLIRPPVTTTISDIGLYDNIWFQRMHLKEYTGLSGVIRFDENIFGNDKRKAKMIVSDHRPVWAKFHTGL